MTQALLAPVARQRVSIDLGTVAPGALLYTYLSGTSTPAAIYSEPTLTTAHTNPVVASAGGLLGPLFAPFGLRYRFTLRQADGTLIYQQDSVATAGDDLQTYDIVNYGAVAGGAVDCLAAINLAIAAAVAAGGGTVYTPPGRYRVSGAVSCTTANIQFLGAGSELSVWVFDDTATKGLVIAGASTNVNTTLSANAALGDRSVTVTSASGLVAGGWAFLFDSQGNTTSLLTTIESIVGTTVTLADSLPGALTTANAAQFFSYTALLTGIQVRHLGFQGGATGLPTLKLTLLELRRTVGHQVEDCAFTGSVGPLITQVTCLDGLVTACLFRNALTTAGSGIETQTSTGMAITACTTRQCQFGITWAASPYGRTENNRIHGRQTNVALGRGIRYGESSNFGTCVGNTVTDPNLFGIYCQDSSDCTISGNTVAWEGDAVTTGQHGIAVGGFETAFCLRNAITGNVIRGASGSGIFVQSNVVGTALLTTIAGNTISSCLQRAILIGSSQNTVTGNVISGVDTNFQFLGVTGANAGRNTIVGNTFYNAGVNNTPSIQTDGGSGLNVIGPNVLGVNATPLVLHATDIVWAPLTVRQAIPLTKTTEVPTIADTLETTAWTVTIPAATLSAAGQGFRARGFFSCGATANNKTVTVYVGTATIAGTTAGNNVGIWVEVEALWVSASAVKFWVMMHLGAGTNFVETFTTSTDNWANAQPFKLTMTNGTAVANDIIFRMGSLVFLGTPATSVRLMPEWPGFVGPAYRTRSATVAADDAVNVYLETSPTTKQLAYYGTPGLKLLTTMTDVGCRGAFAQDGTTWAVVGGGLYTVDVAAGTTTRIGSILDDGHPVSFASNGRGGEQLAIVGGGQLKILSLTTGVLSAAVSLPLTNAPVLVDFLDGYFLLHEADSIRTWFSALEDGTSWDALDFFARSGSSDNLVGILVVGALVWRFGSQTTDCVYNSGDADTPFLPVPNSEIGEGACSPWTIGLLNDAPVWLAQNDHGRGWVNTGTVGSASRLSTPALDAAIEPYAALETTELLIYAQAGHAFAAWTFPGADDAGVTWCYDATQQAWHQRAAWHETLGTYQRWRARGVASTPHGVLVGDYATGALYTLDLDTFTDNGTILRRRRRAPYLANENQWLFLGQVELGAEVGVGLVSGQGVDPVVMLSISRDSARTWGPVTTATLGAIGQYLARAIWRRLGRARSDRLVIEVTQTDPVRTVWTGAWLRATPGTGEL